MITPELIKFIVASAVLTTPFWIYLAVRIYNDQPYSAPKLTGAMLLTFLPLYLGSIYFAFTSAAQSHLAEVMFAAAWIHMCILDFVAAQWIYQRVKERLAKNQKNRNWLVVLAIACLVSGPIGLFAGLIWYKELGEEDHKQV